MGSERGANVCAKCRPNHSATSTPAMIALMTAPVTAPIASAAVAVGTAAVNAFAAIRSNPGLIRRVLKMAHLPILGIGRRC